MYPFTFILVFNNTWITLKLTDFFLFITILRVHLYEYWIVESD